MKKAIVLFLLVLYSVSSIGATINMHYCMDRFSGFSFSSEKKEKCPKCGMKNTACCKDKKKQIKLSLDQQKTGNNLINQGAVLMAPTTSILYDNFWGLSFSAINLTTQNCSYLHSPPIILYQHSQAALSQFLI